MNAKIICRPKSGGTPGQGCPSIVAPQASYAVEFSQHTAKLLLLTQQTALLITGDKKPGTENPRAKRKEYHQHTRINTLNYPSTKAGQVQYQGLALEMRSRPPGLNWVLQHSRKPLRSSSRSIRSPATITSNVRPRSKCSAFPVTTLKPSA